MYINESQCIICIYMYINECAVGWIHLKKRLYFLFYFISISISKNRLIDLKMFVSVPQIPQWRQMFWFVTNCPKFSFYGGKLQMMNRDEFSSLFRETSRKINNADIKRRICKQIDRLCLSMKMRMMNSRQTDYWLYNRVQAQKPSFNHWTSVRRSPGPDISAISNMIGLKSTTEEETEAGFCTHRSIIRLRLWLKSLLFVAPCFLCMVSTFNQ